jgi:hypothetical protein
MVSPAMQRPERRHQQASDEENTVNETATAPAWARGYPLEELRAVAQLYRDVDKPYALGAFSMVKENTVAEWLSEGELLAYANPEPGAQDRDAPLVAACQLVWPQRDLPIRDFTGEVRARIPAGSAVIRHPAMANEVGLDHLLVLARGQAPLTADVVDRGGLWLEGWVENPLVQGLAHLAGLVLHATKIKASSELVGVWGPAQVALGYVHPADLVTLARINSTSFRELAAAAAEEVGGMAGWADHYSSYNAKHSWSALSLRGFADPAEQAALPAQIVKPAEMSKAWKAEHPGWENWSLEWTSLLRDLPAVRALVADLARRYQVSFQRVRLMRLQPGGGELTRHSDITDPEAGTAPGKLARIHVPLITNPAVLFRQWKLSGVQVETNMGPGEVWYLDTRKPHRAGNFGTTERVHLVLDAYVGDVLRGAIAAGQEAAEAAA